MTTDITATSTSTAQEVSTYGVHVYYRDDDSISTMNTLGDGSSSRCYSSSSHNISHIVINSWVVEATDNVSVARGITLESFQAVMYEISKTQVYLRHIMENLSLPADGRPTGNNSIHKYGVSSNTIGNIP